MAWEQAPRSPPTSQRHPTSRALPSDLSAADLQLPRPPTPPPHRQAPRNSWPAEAARCPRPESAHIMPVHVRYLSRSGRRDWRADRDRLSIRPPPEGGSGDNRRSGPVFAGRLALGAERKGIIPNASQAYGFKIPPVLGDTTNVDNIYVIDLVVSLHISGQLPPADPEPAPRVPACPASRSTMADWSCPAAENSRPGQAETRSSA